MIYHGTNTVGRQGTADRLRVRGRVEGGVAHEDRPGHSYAVLCITTTYVREEDLTA